MRWLRSELARIGLALALAVVLFVSINALASRYLRSARLDLTEEQLYTISPETKAILAKIPEQITFKFYYSERLGELVPSYGVYAQRVKELLAEYIAASQGKIKLLTYDPLPFSEIEDDATAAGLQGVPAEEGGEPVYFGLSGTNSTDDQAVIEFFQADRERFLEYDLTKLVETLAFPQKQVLGLVSTIALDTDPVAQLQGRKSSAEAVLEQLRDRFDVHMLPTTLDRVPADINVLMVVQPHDLPPAAEYAIDQFVMGGGHALIFADPWSELAQYRPAEPGPSAQPTAANIDHLLETWGIELVKGRVVGDRSAAVRVNAGDEGHPEPADYLAWIQLKDDQIDSSDPVTAKLGQVMLATAGALRPIKGAKTKFQPLLTSSNLAELIDVNRVKGKPDVLELLQEFKPTGDRYTLAARITGPADTAYPDGPPKPETKSADPAPPVALPTQIKTAKQPLDIIVVGDTDLLDDRFWLTTQTFYGRDVDVPTSNNGDLVENTIENLLGSGELINLRSRGSAVRPFVLVSNMQHQAEDAYRSREKSLQEKLRDTEAKLKDARSSDDGSTSSPVTPEQQKTIDQFRATIIQTRAELRQVQLALRQNIDRLKLELVGLDAGLVPFCVALVALGLSILRRRRRARRARVA